VIVLDTHALVWWVSGSDRLSAPAKRAIARGVRGGQAVAATVSVLEIATAVRRGRLELGSPLGDWLADLCALPELRFEPLSVEIAQLAGSFDDAAPGDPADRIIIATARVLRARLVTADESLRKSAHVEAVW
jgi:PIN domain nuclease of toxin-antitoxin system